MGAVRTIVAVFAGGAAGAVARVALAEALPAGEHGWPWPTFLANVAGCFLLGLVVARVPPASPSRPLLAVGFCGALTTFSTLQIELIDLCRAGRAGLAVGYLAASLAAGLAAVAIGERA